MAMRFNIMGIIFMMVAIWLGTMIGGMVASWIGFAGGIIGGIVIGLVCYVIYTLITGGKISVVKGVIFAVLVWIAQMIAGVVTSAVGIGGGIIGYFVTAIALSFLWGWFGGRGPTASSGKPRTKRRRRR